MSKPSNNHGSEFLVKWKGYDTIAPGSHIHTFRLQLDLNTLSQYGKLVNQKQTNMMLQLTH
jgi:hypothetical protein